MKNLLTVFFLTTLLGSAAYADHHEGTVVEGDVVIEGDNHTHADHHAEGESFDDHDHAVHHPEDETTEGEDAAEDATTEE